MGRAAEGLARQRELRKADNLLELLKGIDINDMTDAQKTKLLFAIAALLSLCDNKGVIK